MPMADLRQVTDMAKYLDKEEVGNNLSGWDYRKVRMEGFGVGVVER